MAKINSLSFYDEAKLGYFLAALAALFYFYYGNGPVDAIGRLLHSDVYFRQRVWPDISVWLALAVPFYFYYRHAFIRFYPSLTAASDTAGRWRRGWLIYLPCALLCAFVTLLAVKDLALLVFFWGAWSVTLAAIGRDIALIALLFFILRYLIQLQQFQADEAVAQAGYRNDLMVHLKTRHHRQRVFAFQPSAAQRINYLLSADRITVYLGFTVATAFIVARLTLRVNAETDRLLHVALSDPNAMMGQFTYNDIYGLIAQAGFILLLFCLSALVSLLLLNHFHRVASTLIYHRMPKGAFIRQLLLALLAVILGALLAAISEAPFRNSAAAGFNAAFHALSGLSLVILLAPTGFVSAFIYLRRYYRTGAGRITWLSLIWTGVSFALQAAWELLVLPASTAAPLSFWLIFILFCGLGAWLAPRLWRGIWAIKCHAGYACQDKDSAPHRRMQATGR